MIDPESGESVWYDVCEHKPDPSTALTCYDNEKPESLFVTVRCEWCGITGGYGYIETGEVEWE